MSMLDINGRKPELYLCTTNRTGGKTTYFSRLLVNRFLDRGEKFGLIYRFNYDMESKRRASGIFHELFLDKVSCGYAISLNSCDQLKKYSHLFSDISRLMFDEFQSESNHYCNDEIKKLLSVHTSIARGNGEQIREVPVFMIGNPVSLINPYYVELGISSRLRDDTKFLKGDGYVLEQGFIESASKAQLDSGFNRAFMRNNYVAYSAECVYLNDSKAFIDKPVGNSRYIGTLKYKGSEYGIREFNDLGIVYCDDRPDSSFKYKITVTTSDHEINYVMLKRNDLFISNLRFYFEHGCFRFKDLRCKEAILKALSY